MLPCQILTMHLFVNEYHLFIPVKISSQKLPSLFSSRQFSLVYVDASDACNVMSFHLSGTGTRSWEIKVTQLKCNFNNLAPSGCTQYFFGKTDGTITSFNFVGGLHLASQNQNICIRREENHCQICYSAADNEFDVSSMLAANKAVLGKSGSCCGFGADGMKTVGYDCVIIPGASKKAGDDLKGSEFCGRQLGTAMSGAEVAAATVCCKFTLAVYEAK